MMIERLDEKKATILIMESSPRLRLLSWISQDFRIQRIYASCVHTTPKTKPICNISQNMFLYEQWKSKLSSAYKQLENAIWSKA